MSTSSVARPRWRNGQILRPAHLRALEGALSSESFVHGGLPGLPAHGLARLVWNGETPRKGVVEIAQVTWITESGEVYDVPGNSETIEPLDLEAARRPEVDIYLHAVRDVIDDGAGPVEPAAALDIPRVSHTLVLSTELQFRGGSAHIRVGRWKKASDGSWRLLPQVVPPLVRVGATPYLTERLAELRRQLVDHDERLRYRLLDMSSRGERIRAVQRARIEARKLDAHLSDLERVHLHPYVVYTRLRDFWLELYMRSETVPADANAAETVPAYDHDDLGACFGAVLAGIAERIQREPLAAPTQTLPFRAVDDRFVVEKVPDAALQAKTLYLIVQKESADAVVPLDDVRLATWYRLHEVHTHMLGVRFRRANEDALARAFGPWVDFYVIVRDPANPEWSAVVEERTLAFYRTARLRNVQAALYWTMQA